MGGDTMRELGLVGLNADGDHVLLSGEQGETFRLRIDDDLLAALDAGPGPASRGDRARRQVGRSMDAAASALRPRDIQARIRAGESPEAVAAVAEVTVERIMAYAVPVLAERDHVCQQARRSGLRRKHASGPGRSLGLAVDEHLRSNGWNPDQASWDAWRREDGRWSVTVSPSRGGEPATFLFDLPGRYVFAHDDAARRLVGDEPPLSVEPEPDEPRTPVRPVDESRQLPEPADVRAQREPSAHMSDDMSADVSAGVAALDAEVAAGMDEPRVRVSALDRLRRQRSASSEPLPFDAEPDARSDGANNDVEAIARVLSVQSPPAPEPRRKSRRASVPSWDEIMFGSKPQG